MTRYNVTRDGRTISTHDTEDAAYFQLHRIQPMSAHWAMTHEGYDIVPAVELRKLSILYTADVITPDGSDTGVYGDACEPGHGATLESGWISPDWSCTTVYDASSDVAADAWKPAGGAPVEWLTARLRDRLGSVEDFDGGSIYAADADSDFVTGVSSRLAAHPKGFTPEEISAAVAAI